MNRTFARATIEINGGRRIPAVIACCSQCGTTEKISANNHSGSIPPEAAANRFRHNGWFIANKDGKDICPKCQAEKKNTKVVKESNVVELAVKAEPPRQMTKEDRRLIFAKIDEVYLDESKGYSSGWSDKKVASDLGVPSAWVRTIREENFGTEGANEELISLIAEAREVERQIREIDAGLVKALKAAEQASAALYVKINDILPRLSKIERDMK